MLEVRKIGHVVAVARHGGFARAAAALHITQSALTKSVQSVEHHLGVVLLERGPRGVRLTLEGEWFMERAARVLQEVEEIETGGSAIRDLRQGNLRIGAAPAALDTLLRDPLAAFARRFPGIRIEVTARSPEEIGPMLLRGELDVAIGALESLKTQKGLEISELYTAPVSLFVRRGHPLDSSAVPTLQEIFRYPLIGPTPPEPHYSLFRRAAVDAGSPYRQPQIVVGSFAITQRLIEQTDGFSFVFEEHTESPAFGKRFRSWPNQLPIPPLAIEMAQRAGLPPNAAGQEIIKIMTAAKSGSHPLKRKRAGAPAIRRR
jgi:DNA-binding transcriptional LysR family regulator